MLIEIGFWRQEEWVGNLDIQGGTDHLPWPTDFIGDSWDSQGDKDTILNYLKEAEVKAVFGGYSICRLCGIQNGQKELTDWTYIWPEGYMHYIEDHGVKSPEMFIAHVLKR